MARVRRYDSGRLDGPIGLPNGWLRADAFVTRAGVFAYKNPDGSTRRELRHPDDVFAPESLATLAMVPVTDFHPSVPLDATNAKSLSVGHLGEKADRAVGDLVSASLLLIDQPAIEAVQRGDRRELSCGYDADLVEESGSYNGEPYDVRQKNIRYNHVAIVPVGRAGPLVRIRTDSGEQLAPIADGAVQVDSIAAVETPPTAPKRAPGGTVALKNVRRNDVSLELDENSIAALDQMLDNAAKTAIAPFADMKQKLADAMKAKETAEGAAAEEKQKAEKAQGKADAAEEELKKLRAAEAKRNLDALVEKVQPIVGAEVKLDGKTPAEIRKLVTEKLTETKLDGKGEAYIEARFDAALEAYEKEQRDGGGSLQDLNPQREDTAGTGGTGGRAKSRLDEADEALLKQNREGWQHPARK